MTIKQMHIKRGYKDPHDNTEFFDFVGQPKEIFGTNNTRIDYDYIMRIVRTETPDEITIIPTGINSDSLVSFIHELRIEGYNVNTVNSKEPSDEVGIEPTKIYSSFNLVFYRKRIRTNGD
jgi:hypothetical protein